MIRKNFESELNTLFQYFLQKPDFYISNDEAKRYFLECVDVFIINGFLKETQPATQIKCPVCNEDHLAVVSADPDSKKYIASCDKTGGIEFVEAESLRNFVVNKITFVTWIASALHLESNINDFNKTGVYSGKLLGKTKGVGNPFEIYCIETNDYTVVMKANYDLDDPSKILLWFGQKPLLGIQPVNIISLFDIIDFTDNQLIIRQDAFKQLEGLELAREEGFLIGMHVRVSKLLDKHYLKMNFNVSLGIFINMEGISPQQYGLLEFIANNGSGEGFTSTELKNENLVAQARMVSTLIKDINAKVTKHGLPDLLITPIKKNEKYKINLEIYKPSL